MPGKTNKPRSGIPSNSITGLKLREYEMERSQKTKDIAEKGEFGPTRTLEGKPIMTSKGMRRLEDEMKLSSEYKNTGSFRMSKGGLVKKKGRKKII